MPRSLTKLLLNEKIISETDLSQLQQSMRENGQSLTQNLISQQWITAQKLLHFCEQHFQLPIFSGPFRPSEPPLIPLELIHRYRVIPIKKDSHLIHLGVADPSNEAAFAAISFQTGCLLKLYLLGEDELDKIIHSFFSSNFFLKHKSMLSMAQNAQPPLSPDLHREPLDEPLIHFVNSLIQEAIRQSISDVHIEPSKENFRVRFRKDGLLSDTAQLPLSLGLQVITRFKVLGNLNIAEQFLPQDGGFHDTLKMKVNVRMSTMPTLYGEKLALRFLNLNHNAPQLGNLGLSFSQLMTLQQALNHPHGLILITGPTGSGKTTTLYAALAEINHLEKNISSIEDPVEMDISGINQININQKRGLDFSSALRALLRQDPDVMMVGEIRDLETATMTLKAAQTGHLVLSTLHTPRAIDVVFRLRALGVNMSDLSEAMTLMVAQRLLRKLCDHCKQPILSKDHQGEKHAVIYKAMGCGECHRGYKGRIGIFEIIKNSSFIKTWMVNPSSTQALYSHLNHQQWTSLWASGMAHVKAGKTSLDELERNLLNLV